MKNRKLKKFIAAAVSAAITLSAFSVFAEPDDTQPTPTNDGVSYTGEEVTPPVAISDEGVQLQNGVDYDITYENNVNVGTATAIITFKGNYSGERRVTFNIVEKNITNDSVVFSSIENQTYTGAAIEVKPVITVDETELVENTDYTLEYTDNIGIGTATIEATFKGNYSGSASTTFEIISKEFSAADIDNGTVKATDIENQTYTGKEIKPEISVMYGDTALIKDRDYTVSYEDNINVGTAKVNISFIGNYSGSASVTFQIAAKDVSNGGVSENSIIVNAIPDQTYTGNEIKPEIVIVDVNR